MVATRRGLKWAKALQGLRNEDSREDAVGTSYILYGGRSAAARLQLRYGFWAEAAQTLSKIEKGDSSLNAFVQGYHAGLLAFVDGMDSVTRGNVGKAEQQSRALYDLLQKLSQARPTVGSDWYFTPAFRILRADFFQLRGMVASAQGDFKQAVGFLQEAIKREKAMGYWEPPHYARPALENLAEVYIKARQWKQARALYEKVLQLRPQSGHALYSLARTSELSGNKKESMKFYRDFLAAWQHADRHLPQVDRAKAWIREQTGSSE